MKRMSLPHILMLGVDRLSVPKHIECLKHDTQVVLDEITKMNNRRVSQGCSPVQLQ